MRDYKTARIVTLLEKREVIIDKANESLCDASRTRMVKLCEEIKKLHPDFEGLILGNGTYAYLGKIQQEWKPGEYDPETEESTVIVDAHDAISVQLEYDDYTTGVKPLNGDRFIRELDEYCSMLCDLDLHVTKISV